MSLTVSASLFSQKLQDLNEGQISAVCHAEGPLMVLAGAGSGKTRVLTCRIIYLVNELDVEPGQIMAVTFTNKAAKEMKARLSELISKELLSRIWVGTFHSICNRLLRTEIRHLKLDGMNWQSNFVIVDASESLSYIKESLEQVNLDEKLYPPKQVQNQISYLKNQCLSPKEYAASVKDQRELKLAQIYTQYQSKLNQSNALDFDDLLLFVIKVMEQNPRLREHYQATFRHILVDEFQDTNQVQYDILKQFTLHPSEVEDWQDRSFCVVGDIDQSIYSWRGANYKLALHFEKDFPQTTLVKLEQNYRSYNTILESANAVIKHNRQRIEKKLIGTRGAGEKIVCFEAADELEESEYIIAELKRLLKSGFSSKQIACLYRTNAQSRSLEDALVKHNLPYTIIGGTRFYERLEIKDLLAYLRLAFNPKDALALKRVINSPRRGIGPSTIQQIEECSQKSGLSLYDALQDLLDSGELAPKVTQAIHGFVELVANLHKFAQELLVPDLLKALLEDTGYLQSLKDANTDEANNRIENIFELLGVAQQFQEESEDKSLEAFLAQVSLVGDSEERKTNNDGVMLMTIHSAKGLEFPVVFLTGLEEGIFPHSRALAGVSHSDDDLEEERRLMYVAITRAKDKLYLTYARRRRIYGTREFAEPSRFLQEIPTENLIGYYGKSDTIRKESQTASSHNSVPEVISPTFEIGQRVSHKTFGEGEVVGIFGGKNQKFYSVLFTQGKKLIAADSLVLHD
ncbi:MAG: 3'-5' exonuclease [Candidatus Caenarcaniphilales bacterium]|nr:3'-5' exonuclease [Candidatus Caenarcaniphilales bacterium]